MQRMTPMQFIVLALLAGCAAALGAHHALLLAVLMPLTAAGLLVDGRASRRGTWLQ